MLLPDPELLRPFSYSHLLFRPTLAPPPPPLPPIGLGVPGAPSTLLPSQPAPRADGVACPLFLLRIFSLAAAARVFCHSGLEDGVLSSIKGLPFLLPLPPALPVAGDAMGERGYRGGVTYLVPWVGGGVAFGSRPSRER